MDIQNQEANLPAGHSKNNHIITDKDSTKMFTKTWWWKMKELQIMI
jgi:hypothetical protein